MGIFPFFAFVIVGALGLLLLLAMLIDGLGVVVALLLPIITGVRHYVDNLNKLRRQLILLYSQVAETRGDVRFGTLL